MTMPFPEPTSPVGSRAEVFTGYLGYFRSRLVSKLQSLPEAELRNSRLPSGWAPIALVKHLRYVERRWLEWGFEGARVDDVWGDSRADRWQVSAGESLDGLVTELADQASRTNGIVAAHDLADIGQPGERWSGAPPATLERVLFHLVQEYARHIGQLDVAAELAGGEVGE